MQGAAPAGTVPLPPALTDFLLLDAEIAGVTERIAVANAALCPAVVGTTGLVLATPPEFDGAARRALAAYTGERPIVTGATGTAGAAGLRFGDLLVAVDGTPVVVGADPQRSFAATRRTYALLDRAAANGYVALDYRRDGHAARAVPATVPACAVRSELTSASGFDASTDGHWIEVRSAVAAFVASPDELAAIIGHELAHVIRGDRGPHRAADRRPAAAERERLADRLGIYLAARAGYDPVRAAAVFARFGRRQGLLHWLDPSHPGFASRAAAVEAEAAAIARGGVHGSAIVVPPALLD